LATLKDREVTILRVTLELGHPHLNDFIRNHQSPTGLKECLDHLTRKRCLHLDHVGNRLCYSITETGRRLLAEHAKNTARQAVDILETLRYDVPPWIRHVQRIEDETIRT
jgi:DNA-binding PadR family transcriptional regulator